MMILGAWLYAALAGVYAGAALYAALIWLRFRLLRPLLLTFMLVSLAGIHALDAWVAFGSLPFSYQWGWAIQWGLRWVAVISAAFVVDLTAASMNSHRAATTIAYIWWMRVSEEPRRNERGA